MKTKERLRAKVSQNGTFSRFSRRKPPSRAAFHETRPQPPAILSNPKSDVYGKSEFPRKNGRSDYAMRVVQLTTIVQVTHHGRTVRLITSLNHHRLVKRMNSQLDVPSGLELNIKRQAVDSIRVG